MKFKFNGKAYRINEKGIDRLLMGLVCVGLMLVICDIVFNFAQLSTTSIL